nr:MAG TPA: hypothetical protein [Caudoviricetes sp.]DAW78110.1 MAG TPA: hypothetical protein [Caudoviricetes sp.]
MERHHHLLQQTLSVILVAPHSFLHLSNQIKPIRILTSKLIPILYKYNYHFSCYSPHIINNSYCPYL